MKKLLCLIGAIAITSSASSSITSFTNNKQIINNDSLELESQQQSISNYNYLQNVQNLRIEFSNLSSQVQRDIGRYLDQLDGKTVDEMKNSLKKSSNSFIHNNEEVILMIYEQSLEWKKLDTINLQISNIPWSTINKYLNIGASSSNDYSMSYGSYGPSHWWNAIWDWGGKWSIHEGYINLLRLLKPLYETYGTDFTSLIDTMEKGKSFVDYVVNIDKHDKDTIDVLKNLVNLTSSDFRSTGLPFTDSFYSIFAQFNDALDQVWDGLKIGAIKQLLISSIENEIGMTIAQFKDNYYNFISTGINALESAQSSISKIKSYVPSFIWTFISGGVYSIVNQMINADSNKNGVYIKFEQYYIPKGFKAL